MNNKSFDLLHINHNRAIARSLREMYPADGFDNRYYVKEIFASYFFIFEELCEPSFFVKLTVIFILADKFIIFVQKKDITVGCSQAVYTSSMIIINHNSVHVSIKGPHVFH
ncbi:hypothetical protein D3C73_884950 [compost metagenome]